MTRRRRQFTVRVRVIDKRMVAAMVSGEVEFYVDALVADELREMDRYRGVPHVLERFREGVHHGFDVHTDRPHDAEHELGIGHHHRILGHPRTRCLVQGFFNHGDLD